MKLKNKKTGEIGWLYCDHISVPKKMTVFSEDKDLSAKHWDYDSLAELASEWEDYEESKEYWFVNSYGAVEVRSEEEQLAVADMHKMFGNYFETKEEAEKACEKLKAWKRLKDKGFRFSYHSFLDRKISYKVKLPVADEEIGRDLDLLFGGNE